jgi:hypothetical protein
MKLYRRKPARGSAASDRGSALLMSLITVMLVAGLAAAYLQTSAAITKRQRQAVDTKQAFYVAEAGLSEAFSGMMIGKSGNVGTMEAPARFGRGCFWVEAEEAGENLVELSSTGLYGGGRATLSLVVEKGGQSVASLGIFSDGALSVPDGAKIDAYNSSLGSYESQADSGLLAQVGSNQGVSVSELLQSTEIYGDVVPGVGAQVTVTGNPTITGQLDPRAVNSALPDVNVPPVSMIGSTLHSSLTPLSLPPGSYGYSSLTVAPLAKVVLHGPCEVVFGNLVLQPTAQLELDTTLGPVSVYVTGTLSLLDGSQVGTIGTDPSAVSIQLADATTSLVHPQGSLYGSIFGPQATLDIGSQLELYGGLVADRLLLQPGTKLHFDQHLAVKGAESTLPTLFSWRIVDFAPLGPEPDPFLVLGVVESALPLPGDAHADQLLDVTYSDLTGTKATYSGPESLFDWANVTYVYDLTRDGTTTSLTTTATRNLLVSP